MQSELNDLQQIFPQLLRRLFSSALVLVLVMIGTFCLLELAPGDAVDAYAVSYGGNAGDLAAMRAAWGLDQSFVWRLGAYAYALLHGNLGWSVSLSRPVLTILWERLPNTLLLMGTAIALSFLIGSLLGIVAGSRPGSWRDRFLSVTALILYAIPGFWLALVLVLLFSIRLRWLPSSGIETIASGKQGWARALDIMQHLVLPVMSLALIYLALYLRTLRTAMADVWQAKFIIALQLRGLSRRRIIFNHVLRNAALPVITMLGLQAAAMLGGSVVIESVFAVPGLGRLAQEAVAGRDTPLLLGVILLSALMVIIVNFIVDMLYPLLDPRIATGGRQQ